MSEHCVCQLVGTKSAIGAAHVGTSARRHVGGFAERASGVAIARVDGPRLFINPLENVCRDGAAHRGIATTWGNSCPAIPATQVPDVPSIGASSNMVRLMSGGSAPA
jgi:hypothetical protein